MKSSFRVNACLRNFEIASAVLEGGGYHQVSKRFGVDPEDVRTRTHRYCLQVNPVLFERLASENPDEIRRFPRMEQLRAHRFGFLPVGRWFGDGGASVLAENAGRIGELLHVRFKVLDPWHFLYPEGATGEVDTVLFRDGCWLVGFDMDGAGGGYEELPIQEFLRRTAPLEGGSDA